MAPLVFLRRDNMANSLITPYEYMQYFGLSAINATQIQVMLDYSTDLIQTYCDRKFEAQTYSDWYAVDANSVQLDQYPINRLYFVKSIENIGTITSSNTAIEQSYAKTDDSIYITLDQAEIALPLSGYTNLGTLSAALSPSGINVSILVSELYPTTYITNKTDSIDGLKIEGASLTNLTAMIDRQSTRTVLLDEFVQDVYVKYNAGYTFSQDTSAHDGLVITGNVPNDLKQVCAGLSQDIAAATTISYTNNGTVPQLLMKSESIGDYSYNRFDETGQIQYMLSKYVANSKNNYTSVLDSYRKKSFG